MTLPFQREVTAQFFLAAVDIKKECSHNVFFYGTAFDWKRNLWSLQNCILLNDLMTRQEVQIEWRLYEKLAGGKVELWLCIKKKIINTIQSKKVFMNKSQRVTFVNYPAHRKHVLNWIQCCCFFVCCLFFNINAWLRAVSWLMTTAQVVTAPCQDMVPLITT